MVPAIHCYFSPTMAVKHCEKTLVLVAIILCLCDVCILLYFLIRLDVTYHIESPALHVGSTVAQVFIFTDVELYLLVRLVQVH